MARERKHLDQATKARLREHAARKRQQNPKARDYTLADWLWALDQVIEAGFVDTDADAFRRSCSVGTVRHLPFEVQQWLPTVLVHDKVRQRRFNLPPRVLPIYRLDTVVALCKVLRLNPETYVRHWFRTDYQKWRVAPTTLPEES